MKGIERILMATDFSVCADAAAEVAAQLSGQLNAPVDVLTVIDTLPLVEAYGDASFRAERVAEIHQEAHKRIHDFAKRHFAGRDRVRVYVRDGNTSSEIVQAGRDLESDLIVMGTHGRTGLLHLVVGSVAEKVIRKSLIPVLTVRGRS